MLSSTALELLRNRLPRGKGRMIHDRLSAKGIKLSMAFISMVLAGKHWNERVIEEAILLAEEHEEKMRELARRIQDNIAKP